MRNFFKQFLSFKYAELTAFLLLLTILLITYFIPKIYERFFYKEKIITVTNDEKEKIVAYSAQYDALKIAEQNQYENRYHNKYNYATTDYYHKSEKPTATLFPFDPNTLSIEGWQQLGLSEKQATVIDNYRKKGGKFRKPEDIRKIFVIKDELKEKLLPYVQIKTTFDTIAKPTFYTQNNTNPEEKKFDYDAYKKAKEAYQSNIIDINTADSAAFEKLKWVGAAMAGRIIKFREEAGGFYAIKQLKDVWGMNDSIYSNIKPHLQLNNKTVRKININKADYETLRRHPYIRGNIAKLAINYRRNNNGFKDITQFARVPEMNEEVYRKLLPYLTLE